MSTPEEKMQQYGIDYDSDWRNGQSPTSTPQIQSPPIDTPAEEVGQRYGIDYDSDWRTPKTQEVDDYGWGITAAFARGFERLRAMPDVAQGDYEELAAHYESMEDNALSDEDAARLEEIRNTPGFWAKVGELIEDPRLVGQTVAESLPMMAAPIVGGVGGGIAGGSVAGPPGAVGGAMAGGAVGSFGTEYFNAIGEFFSENGVDMKNSEQLKAAFQDAELMSGAREFATKRGIPIAVFDALSMGLAGRIAKPVAGMARKVAGRSLGAGGAAELGMQAGFGMAGEAGAQLASKGEITDQLDVILEGAGEIVPGVVEAGVSRYVDSRAARKTDGTPDPDSPLSALQDADRPDPVVDGAELPETDVDPRTGRVVQRTGDLEVDELDQALEQAAVELDLDIERGAIDKETAEKGAARAQEIQGARNTQMIQMEAQRDQQLAKQGALEEARKAAEEDQAYRDRELQAIESEEAMESETVTPQGQPVTGEPIDLEGAQPADEGAITPQGVNPAGGRPLGTSLGEAMRQAGVKKPQDDNGEGGGGVGLTRGPDVSPAERRATEALEQESPKLESAIEANEERAAIQEESTSPIDEYDDSDVPFSEDLSPDAEMSPAVEFADQRLERYEGHQTLDKMLEDVTEGGSVSYRRDENGNIEGRTPSTNPSWFQSIVADEKVGMKYVQSAVDKAKEGKRLGDRQKRIVQSMLDEYEQMESEYRSDESPTDELGTMPVEQQLTEIQDEIRQAYEPEGLNDFDVFMKNDEIRLDFIEIDEGSRRQGIGTKAVNELIDFAEDTNTPIRLEVAKDETSQGDLDERPGLQEFYEKLGFRRDPQFIDEFVYTPSALRDGPLSPPGQPQSRSNQSPEIDEEGNVDMFGGRGTATEEETTPESVDADTGVPGDLFSATANQQVDLEEQTGRADLSALADEAEVRLDAMPSPVEKTSDDYNMVVADIRRLKMNKHPRADELAGKLEAKLTEQKTVESDSSQTERDEAFVALADQQRGEPSTVEEAKTMEPLGFDEEGPDTEERVFTAIPPINKRKRVAIDTRLKREGNKYITPEEAQERLSEWEANAIAQGKASRQSDTGPQNHKDNFNRVIISLFDTTGNWANPYALAGYDVRTLDIKDGIDVTDFSVQFLEDTFGSFEGKEIYGVLAACPCTTFSNSSTKWRRSDLPPDHPQNRHENADPEYSRKWIREMWGDKAADAVDENGDPLYATPHEYGVALVNKTLQTLEYLRPQFWVVENPEGRIEEAGGLPNTWRTGFQPSNFGDPYQKRTLLWGNFNDDLPTANVDPVEGSKMHKLPPSETRAAQRSETPEGFALAFFQANNYLDTSPVERTMKDYWYVAGAVQEALKAGVTEDEIRANAYLDQAYDPDSDTVEGAKEALRELIDSRGGTPPPTPGTPAIPSETEIEQAANEADPENASDAQKAAGNYKKGHLSMAGFDIAIENPAGTKRHGNLKLRDHYGYIKRTEGADGDQVDVFVNSKAAEDFAGDVYVVDQIDPETKKFDEHKVMLGYNNTLDARRAYKRNYNKDWKGEAGVTKMTLSEFQSWLDNPKTSSIPATESDVTQEGKTLRKSAQDDKLFEEGQDLLGGNKQWLVEVLKHGQGDIRVGPVDTSSMNQVLDQIERSDEALAALDKPKKLINSEIDNVVADINEAYPAANAIAVRYEDAPQELRDRLQKESPEVVDKVDGLYDRSNDQIYVFTDRIGTADRGKRIVLHEMFHKGLTKAFGDDVNSILDDFYANMPDKHKALLKETQERYGLADDVLTDQREAAEEVLAQIAETDPKSTVLQNVIAKIRSMLERIGLIAPSEQWTDKDIIDLIAEAKGSLERQARIDPDAVVKEDVQLEETGEVYQVEQNGKKAINDLNRRLSLCAKLRNCL